MKITGELLKSERIKKNLSVQDIAHSLKLSPRTIVALEEGDLSQLPAKAFVRGFVKSYSDYLKLDSNLIMNQFQEEMGLSRPKTTLSPSINETPVVTHPKSKDSYKKIETITPDLKNSFNKNTLVTIVFITFALIAIAGINQVITKYKNEGLTSAVQDSTIKTTEENKAADSTIPSAEISSDTAVTQPTSQSSDKLNPPAPTVAVQPDIKTIENQAPLSTSQKTVEVVLEALKSTTISYTKGQSADFKTFTLKENTFQIIKSSSGLLLKIQNGNAVQLTVNGINKGLASSNDKPVEFNF